MPTQQQSNKDLGTALERRIAKRAQSLGLTARRQPGSGAWPEYPHDVVILLDGERLLVEAKVRSVRLSQKGRRSLPIDLAWYDSVRADARRLGYTEGVLIVNAKGSREPLVVCDLAYWLGVLAAAERNKPDGNNG